MGAKQGQDDLFYKCLFGRQVAEAAHAPLELVDLVWLSYPAPTASNRKVQALRFGILNLGFMV